MKHLITSIAALGLLAGAASAQVGILDTVVNPANGHTYHLLDNSDWIDAETTAIALGGHLATVEDLAENTFLTSNFSDFGGTTRHLWIGYTDTVTEGTWLWASGSTSPFTNWWTAGGAPNNSTANDPKGEDFCCIYPTGEWEDLHNHASSTWFPVLCGVVEIEGTGTPYCAGDGSGALCPCGNDNDGSLLGAGCANGQYASGALLSGMGVPSLSNDTLTLIGEYTEHNQFGLFFQADNNLGLGTVWGDGLRCAGGGLKRLGTVMSDGAGHSDTTGYGYTISSKAGNINAGDTKYYQLWYRNPLGSPCANDFNTSNGLEITWTM